MAGLAMSPAITITLLSPLISLAALSSLAVSLPLSTTEAPSATSLFAVSLPMPEPPPVTIATLSLNRISSLPVYLVIDRHRLRHCGFRVKPIYRPIDKFVILMAWKLLRPRFSTPPSSGFGLRDITDSASAKLLPMLVSRAQVSITTSQQKNRWELR